MDHKPVSKFEKKSLKESMKKEAKVNKKVAVVGVYQTKYERRKDVPVRTLVYNTTKSILKKAGINREDLDTIITSTSDPWQGITCSNSYYYEAGGSYLKDSTKVEEDSMLALIYAWMRILSGHFNSALVLGVTKMSEVPSSSILTNLYMDPLYQRAIGVEEISAFALQARKYMEKGANARDFGRVSIKNLKNGLYNDRAQRKMDIDLDDVERSPYVAYPLREIECPPKSDGACAMLLASEEKAREFTDAPAWILGAGWCSEEYFLGDRDLTRVLALRKASKKAYEMADIDDPLKELDVAEISEICAPQELIWYENMGISEKGYELIRNGTTQLSGELPVNPSGGVLAANPFVARGLVRAAEASLQVMGKASGRQIEGVEMALSHSASGPAGQNHSIVIFGR